MKLVQTSENLLTYDCLENPEEHVFRYNINQKTWEKVMIKTKLILRYKQNPCEETVFEKIYMPD